MHSINDQKTDKNRKKALTREYKRTPKRMGVYTIVNLQNHKQFVGVSRDVDARLNRHRFALNTNTEEIAELQTEWNDYGADAFVFSLLDELTPPQDSPNYDPQEDLEALHRLWLAEIKPFTPQGYNKPL